MIRKKTRKRKRERKEKTQTDKDKEREKKNIFATALLPFNCNPIATDKTTM